MEDHAIAIPVQAGAASAVGCLPESWNPSRLTAEGEGAFLITVDLPGVVARDIAVQLADRSLIIAARRVAPGGGREGAGPWSGSFIRTLTVPDGVDLAGIAAAYAAGRLTVTLPKRPPPRARAIPISLA